MAGKKWKDRERRRIKDTWNERILFLACLVSQSFPILFSSIFPAYVKTGLFFQPKYCRSAESGGRRTVVGADVGRRNRVKKCDGNERKNVAKRANRGGEKKEGKEQKRGKRRERERENSLRVEFPLLFDLPTHAFCFPTADVALEIKDLKHTPRGGKVRGEEGSFLLPSSRHGSSLPFIVPVYVAPKSPVKNRGPTPSFSFRETRVSGLFRFESFPLPTSV